MTTTTVPNPLAQFESNLELQAEIRAAEAVTPQPKFETQAQKPASTPKQKLAKNILHPDIPNGVPLKFQGMLHQCWMLLRDLELDSAEEIRLRLKTAAFWVDLNKKDERFDVLIRLSDETKEPVLLVSADFRPEALNNAAMRHLRILKKKGSPIFAKALSRATMVDIVSTEDVEEFFTK